MHRIFAITWLHLKEFFKSPGAWVLMVIMPAVFGIVFGGMSVNSGKYTPVVNIVSDNGKVNSQVVNLLKKSDKYNWKIVSEEKAKENVLKEEAIAAIIVPDDIEKRMDEKRALLNVYVQKKDEYYMGLMPHLEGTARVVYQSYQSINKEAFPKLLEAVSVSQEVKINQKIIQKDEDSIGTTNLMFVGFAVMFMMFGISGAASAILDEKAGGTWGRLFISPAGKIEICFGYLLSYFLMGWVQFAILMTVMNLVFETDWGNLTYLIPFASLVILCVTGFGLMIAGLVKTKKQASSISAVLIVSTCMLGGVYWPLDIVPGFMRMIALGVPQSWAMSGFEEIMSGSLHTATLVKDTGVLLGFTIVFLLIGLRLVKYE